MNISVEVHGEIIIVKISGEFYLGNIKEVEKMWDDQVQKQPRVIAFDCRNLSFIDSSAIGTLVKFLNNSDKFDIRLVFFDLTESIEKIFITAKLNKIFTITTEKEFREEYLPG